MLDNLSTHRATDVLLFALAHPRWEFVFQPTYAAYLNLIEPWWKILRALALKGRRFEAWPEIEEAVRRPTEYWNGMAVGNRVTPVPPHRTGRAAFPHPAPTSDMTAKPCGRPYALRRL
ncbi:MAG TPA: transposase [Thermomicrobiales bacterium]|nr:transposase [Thermomicrobiales bacterium]